MKVQLNNVYRTNLYRSVSKGKPKHLRLTLLNALKQELEAGTYILWNAYCLERGFLWNGSALGFGFWNSLHTKFNGETLND